jgi:phosphate starvation-inducible PhoH-like protein
MSNKEKTPNTEKRGLKTEPKLNVVLNDEQKEVTRLIYEYDVVFVEGLWGTGKTLSSVATALKCFRKKEFDEIIITRPFIADKLGALPGGILDKLYLEMQPILDNFNKCQSKITTEKMLKDDLLKVQYNGKVKGNTFSKAICICDETTDLTTAEFTEMITRLGKDSKIIFTLSKEQIHKSIGKNSCYYTIQKLRDSGLVGWVELKENHRNPIITKITEYLDIIPK